MRLILGGTSDTHRYISNHGGDYIITVATEYGYALFSHRYDNVRLIRFEEESLKNFISEHSITEIIDTTHPFAKVITALAKQVSAELSIPYRDEMRTVELKTDYQDVYYFDTYEEAVEFIIHGGFTSVLLTTGANNIERFSPISDRCTARVLPFEKSIEKCRLAGFEYKSIIGMQGPFSQVFNTAMMKEIKADALVTKMSGETGGVDEKIESCRETKAACIVITGG